MTKQTVARLLGWLQLFVVYFNDALSANGGVIPTSKAAWGRLIVSFLTAIAVHKAAGTSDSHPDGAVKSALSVVLCVALVGGTLPLSGCTQSQWQTVHDVVVELNNVKGYLGQVQQLAADFHELDPKTFAEIGEYAKLAGDNVDSLITIGNQYLASPSGNGYQSLLNGVDAVVSRVDSEMLAAARIENPASQRRVLLALGLFATGAHIVLGILNQNATTQQLKAMPPKLASVPIDKVRPYLDRDFARRELSRLGYNAEASFAAAGL